MSFLVELDFFFFGLWEGMVEVAACEEKKRGDVFFNCILWNCEEQKEFFIFMNFYESNSIFFFFVKSCFYFLSPQNQYKTQTEFNFLRNEVPTIWKNLFKKNLQLLCD